MYSFKYAHPEAVGVPSSALMRLLDRLESIDVVHSLMLLRHGRVFMEGVRAPFDSETPHQVFSLSKSFTSVAIGLAREEGRLQLDDRLIDFFPEHAASAHPLMREVRLSDLLSMQSGFRSCVYSRIASAPDGDLVRAYLALVPDGRPGTFFAYNSCATYMLGAVLRRVSGETVREYLMPRLFEPLDIIPGIWESCPRGLNYAGWGLYLRIRDLAKFAQLLLDGGRYEGRQLIPAGYLAEAVKPHADNSANRNPDWRLGYGYQFWRSTYGFRGDGASGQYAVVLPEFDLAIAMNSAAPDMQRILTALWEELIPALSPGALPEAPAEQRELAERLSRLSVAPVAGDVSPQRLRRSFSFAENASGIIGCEVECGEKECALTFRMKDGTVEQLRAGFGYFAFGVFKLTDRAAHPVAASAAWRAGRLVVETFILNGIYRSTYTVDFADGAPEPLKREDLCACFRPPMARLFAIRPCEVSR